MGAMRFSTRVLPTLGFLAVTGFMSAAASAQLTPVSWHLHAQASAGTVSHNPPDVVLGSVFGSNSDSANAAGENGQAGQFNTGATVNATQISLNMGGSATTPSGGSSAGGSGFIDLVFSTQTTLTIRASEFNGGNSQWIGGMSLTNSIGTQFYTGGNNVMFNLPSDTYTIHTASSGGAAAGNASSGFRTNSFTVVPEPASATTLALAALALFKRRR